MNDNKGNSHFEIHDLIDDAVNNALARRSEALLLLGDDEAKSISGGKVLQLPTVHGVVINPCPQPTPIVHGKIINPCPQLDPIALGMMVAPQN
jgi:hypothetical protein